MLDRKLLLQLPARKAYRAIVRQVFDEELRSRQKLPREKLHIAKAAFLHEQIRNGGIGQYFTNSFAKDLDVALEGLRAIGAKRQDEIVLKWLNCLPPTVNHQDARQVGEFIFGSPAIRKQFESIDQEYFAASESFYSAVVNYVVKHLDIFRGVGPGSVPSI